MVSPFDNERQERKAGPDRRWVLMEGRWNKVSVLYMLV
jgi:hypothetical protein